jgi:hypothetical protein
VTVVTDSSPVGLGAALIQVQDMEPQAIWYPGRTLNEVQQRYSQTEEAVAIPWDCKTFHRWLLGNKLTLVVNHKHLATNFGPHCNPNARIQYRLVRMQSFKYEVIYKLQKWNLANLLSHLLQPALPLY